MKYNFEEFSTKPKALDPLNKETGLTLMHYKEPLRLVPEGYGYIGALLCTEGGEKVQCHVCGKLFSSLAMHITQKHMPVREYREKFEISRQTALVSEIERNRMKDSGLAYWESLSVEQRRALSKKRARAHSAWFREHVDEVKNYRWKIRAETKNKRGTCPDQLLEKIREVKEDLGHTPSLAEFITATNGQRYKHLIFTTFGSWVQALHLLGLQPKENTHNKGRKYHNHTKEQLLESLHVFAKEFKKVPTATDCKRGLIYPYDTYQRHFGSFESARKQAGVYKVLGY